MKKRTGLLALISYLGLVVAILFIVFTQIISRKSYINLKIKLYPWETGEGQKRITNKFQFCNTYGVQKESLLDVHVLLDGWKDSRRFHRMLRMIHMLCTCPGKVRWMDNKLPEELWKPCSDY